MSHYPDSEYATLVTTGWLQVAAISPLVFTENSTHSNSAGYQSSR